MGYPAVNLLAANAIFSAIGVEIKKHDLGYYHATILGQEMKEARLIDLTHVILNRLLSAANVN